MPSVTLHSTSGDVASSLYWRLPELTPKPRPTSPLLPGIQKRFLAIPPGRLPGQAIPVDRQRRPTRSKGPPAKSPNQSGTTREFTPGPRSRNCSVGRAANGINPRPATNGGGGEIDKPPRGKQRLDGRSPFHDSARQQHVQRTTGRAKNLVARNTTTGLTKKPVSVRTGQHHPAANPSEQLRRARGYPMRVMSRQPWQPTADEASIRSGVQCAGFARPRPKLCSWWAFG
jgi:hypothetical protein